MQGNMEILTQAYFWLVTQSHATHILTSRGKELRDTPGKTTEIPAAKLLLGA